MFRTDDDKSLVFTPDHTRGQSFRGALDAPRFKRTKLTPSGNWFSPGPSRYALVPRRGMTSVCLGCVSPNTVGSVSRFASDVDRLVVGDRAQRSRLCFLRARCVVYRVNIYIYIQRLPLRPRGTEGVHWSRRSESSDRHGFSDRPRPSCTSPKSAFPVSRDMVAGVTS